MASGYNDDFFDDLQDTQVPSARSVVPFLAGLIKPSSVVDVGCGRGFWLSEFAHHGAEQVFGVDGPWAPVDKLAISGENFKSCNLDEAIRLERKFDLAISLEVAEHLPAERAESFVRDLCNLAPAVFFGAAIPGQGGLNHYNEQWPSYWAALFGACGYTAYDVVRPAFWSNQDVTWWYKQNTALYVEKSRADAFPELQSYQPCEAADLPALVHPELFEQKVKAANPGFGSWLKKGKQALLTSANKRKRR